MARKLAHYSYKPCVNFSFGTELVKACKQPFLTIISSPKHHQTQERRFVAAAHGGACPTSSANPNKKASFNCQVHDVDVHLCRKKVIGGQIMLRRMKHVMQQVRRAPPSIAAGCFQVKRACRAAPGRRGLPACHSQHDAHVNCHGLRSRNLGRRNGGGGHAGQRRPTRVRASCSRHPYGWWYRQTPGRRTGRHPRCPSSAFAALLSSLV